MAAEKAVTHSVARSPEVLDIDKLNKWLSGSIYGILGLNLLALGLFLCSILQPQIRSLQAEIGKRWAARKAAAAERAEAARKEKELKDAHKDAAKKEAEATKPAEAAAPAAIVEAPPMQTAGVTPGPPTADIPPPPAADIPPPPAAEAAPTAEAAPAVPPPAADAPRPLAEAVKNQVQEAKKKVEDLAANINLDDINKDLSSMLAEATATDGAAAQPQNITEAIDVAAINNDLASLIDAELKNTPPPPPPAFEEKTEILSKEERPDFKASDKNAPLPEAPVSAQTTSGEKSLKTASAFEKSLEDLLNTPTDQTEEVPLFDADALEESLKKLTDEDPKA